VCIGVVYIFDRRCQTVDIYVTQFRLSVHRATTH